MNKIKSILKNKKTIILLVFSLIFILIVKLLSEDKLIYVDNYVYRIINKINSPYFTTFFKIITSFSSSIVLVIITLFFIIKRSKYSFLITINLIISAVTNYILKLIFSRPRPTEIMLIEESGYSFPSGHSMVSLAYYGFIIYLISISKINKKIKIILYCFLNLLILLIGISRIYLGVHYFSDVIAGYTVSIIYLVIFISITNRGERYVYKFRKR